MGQNTKTIKITRGSTEQHNGNNLKFRIGSNMSNKRKNRTRIQQITVIIIIEVKILKVKNYSLVGDK